jgi:hypothetical protein
MVIRSPTNGPEPRRNSRARSTFGVEGATMTLAILLAVSAAASVNAQGGDASEAFTRLRLLQGNWRGTSTRGEGANKKTAQINATYRLTGNGSVVIEELSGPEQPSMTTAYHLDNGDLRMTHYCAAENQPRMKAGSIDLAKNVIRFDFVDITNLRAPDAAHIHGLTMRMVDKDHLELVFTILAKGKEGFEHMSLTRVAST